MVILDIPNGSGSAALVVANSLTDPETSKLSRIGFERCLEARPFWQAVASEIQERFGPAKFHYADMPPTGCVCSELWLPDRLIATVLLNLSPELRYVVKRVLARASTGDQPFTSRDILTLIRTTDFHALGPQRSGRDSTLAFARLAITRPWIGVGHEPALSLAAHGLIPDAALGLGPCEGVIFYTTGNAIIGAEKLVPQ